MSYIFLMPLASIRDIRTYAQRSEQKRRYMNAIVFFIKTNGLYDCFKRNGGSLKSVITYSSHSMDEKLTLIRDYTC